MVPEIATALTGLAMTVGDSGWSHFAGSAVVVPGHTAERHEGRSLHYKTKVRKNPPFPEKRGISLKNCSSRYAERMLATGRAVSARLAARTIYQARIGTGTAGRAVSARLTARKTHQARICPRRLAAKKSPDSGESGDLGSLLVTSNTPSGN